MKNHPFKHVGSMKHTASDTYLTDLDIQRAKTCMARILHHVKGYEDTVSLGELTQEFDDQFGHSAS